jgi:hypothetical protein
MRLGEAEPRPVNLDRRNQILRDIAYGRKLIADSNARIATVPAGRPRPFEEDQAAYEASIVALRQTDPTVTTLETRLTVEQGPYWKDMTQQEIEALALWTEAAKQLNDLTSEHYPSPMEMDIKKAILMVIGVGAFFAPLLFTKEGGDVGFPFRVLPNPPELPFDRAPQALPYRSQTPALPYRGGGMVQVPSRAVPAISYQAPAAVESPVPDRPSVVARSGYTPPPRFSRGFAVAPGGSSGEAPVRMPPLPGAMSPIPRPPRSEGGGGERRYIYPKPSTT